MREESRLNERFEQRLMQVQVRRDIKTLGDFTAIYCRGNHADRTRRAFASDAADLGAYGRKPPVVCDECAEHLRYGEKRRAYCPKDPKPFCAHCDTHCYKADESEWQRQMMRYSGPRSALHGYAIAGIRHAMEARTWRREMERRAAETSDGTTTGNDAAR
jgi:hypothetical protein